MESSVGPILLLVVLLLMALFAISVFIFSRKSQTSLKEDDVYEE